MQVSLLDKILSATSNSDVTFRGTEGLFSPISSNVLCKGETEDISL